MSHLSSVIPKVNCWLIWIDKAISASECITQPFGTPWNYYKGGVRYHSPGNVKDRA